MKIKAIYGSVYMEEDEQIEEVLIIGFTNNQIVCVDKFGRLFYASRKELQVVDKEYLDLLKENDNEYSIYRD